jgi:hypothetical protein
MLGKKRISVREDLRLRKIKERRRISPQSQCAMTTPI